MTIGFGYLFYRTKNLKIFGKDISQNVPKNEIIFNNEEKLVKMDQLSRTNSIGGISDTFSQRNFSIGKSKNGSIAGSNLTDVSTIGGSSNYLNSALGKSSKDISSLDSHSTFYSVKDYSEITPGLLQVTRNSLKQVPNLKYQNEIFPKYKINEGINSELLKSMRDQLKHISQFDYTDTT